MQREPNGYGQPPHLRAPPSQGGSTGAGIVMLLVGGGVLVVVSIVALLVIASTDQKEPAKASTAESEPMATATGGASDLQCEKRGPEFVQVARLDPARGVTEPECQRRPKVGDDGTVSRVVWEAYEGAGTWPVTVDSGKLVCTGANFVFFDSDAARYAVNGAAGVCVGASAPAGCGDRPAKDLEEIWLADPRSPKGAKPADLKIDLGAFVKAGLALCER